MGCQTFAPYASCSHDMDVDTLVECITVEGSDTNYQKWKQEYDLIGTGMSKEEDQSLRVTVEDYKQYQSRLTAK